MCSDVALDALTTHLQSMAPFLEAKLFIVISPLEAEINHLQEIINDLRGQVFFALFHGDPLEDSVYPSMHISGETQYHFTMWAPLFSLLTNSCLYYESKVCRSLPN